MTLTRRGFLAASAAMAATTTWPRLAAAGEQPLSLTATTRVIEVDGCAATVMGLANGSGRQGLILDPGQRFRVDLTNDLAEDTIIHWHGQIPPNAQDGVPGLPMPLLMPGETRSFDYAPLPGTFWMHSHVPLQEMSLLAAPLIVRRPEDLVADRQEAVMFLHDFSFRAPAEVMAELVEGGGHHDMAAMGAPAAGHGAMADMDHSGMMMPGMMMDAPGHAGMDGMAMDLNDIEFDAYLANDRTLVDPEVIAVERGGHVLLRVINAAAATSFWIDTFPILALREGARERTGIVLATPGASVPRIETLGDSASGAFDLDLAQEGLLRATLADAEAPLAARPADRSHMIVLGGSMQPYFWTIDGRTWGDHTPIAAKTGERVHLTFHNMSMMGHPMHLHGHVFQVVGVNGQAIAGAVRDTVYVPPMAMVTVALDAGEAARWMLHCHHMPHLFTGMMTEFAVTA